MAESHQKHILCVCTGNICRSPMAEKLLKHALNAESPPLSEIPVVSAGVSAYPGERASRNSSHALKKVGLDLAEHRSRRVNPEVLEKSALILCMTESHRLALMSQFEDISAPIFLFREFLGDEDLEIPDPFGGPLEMYEDCRDSIVEAVPAIIRHLKKEMK